MASQIFPHNTDLDMGSKIQFSGIDWDGVEKSMKNQRFAMDNTDDIMAAIAQLTGTTPEQVEEVISEFLPEHGDSSESPDGFAEPDEEAETETEETSFGGDNHFSNEMPQESNLEHSGFGGDNSDSMPPRFSQSKKMTKIAFTSSDQISAEAIEAAIAKGDQKLVNTILAARKENRMRIAKAIENKMKKEASNSKTQVKTSNKETKVSKTSDEGFVSPSEFTKAQRLAFNQAARTAGFPEEYINSMIPQDPAVTNLNNKLKEVFSSTMSSDIKTTVVKTLIKEAKLSPDSKSEFIDYWNNVLGYQDKDFWPAVAADYDAGKKVS